MMDIKIFTTGRGSVGAVGGMFFWSSNYIIASM